MKKVTTLSALAVLAGIAAVDIWGSGTDQAEGVSGKEGALDRSADLTGVNRARVPLSKSAIIDRLPDKIPSVRGTGLWREQSEHLEIFSKLGALEGEAAVDFLFEKYGKSQSAYLPMIFAMKGWMEKDLEAGLAAFKGFLRNGQAGFAYSISSGELFQWKGEGFHSGLS